MSWIRPHAQALLVLAIAAGPALGQAQVPTPESILGFAPGTDGMLADYSQILDYFRQLDLASERVQMRVVGKSTEGRDLVLAILTSPKNHLHLEQLRTENLRFGDPRTLSAPEAELLAERGKVVVLINESIHSNEVGPAQAGMTTAHFLATTQDPKWLEVLENVIVLLNPCHNPDGYEAVVAWWNKTKDDSKTRGAPLPVLYHKYVGHDNNRDWFMLTQQESRVTVLGMHREWRPAIVVDQHQMGVNGPRMFVPPFLEPWEPNIHPLIRSQLEHLGRFVVKSMSDKGMAGVVCNRMFDAWSPSRAYMHYHGGVRVLTEVASVHLADPVENTRDRRSSRASREGGERADSKAEDLKQVNDDHPLPWSHGRWTLQDIVTYCREGALLAIRHASDHRRTWILNSYRIASDACESRDDPQAYLIPVGQPRRSALKKLVDILQLGGVEIDATAEDFVVSGRVAPVGSLLIRSGQPHFPFVRALFERTPYPEIRTKEGGPIRRPYDVTAHNLPLLMNLQVHALGRGPLPLSKERFSAASLTVSEVVHGSVLLDPRDEGSYVDALAAQAAGARVERVPFALKEYPPGAFIVRSKGEVRLRHAPSQSVPLDLQGLPLAPAPRVGIYWSWMANMDEGWTRFFFDMFQLPFVPLRNADIRKGDLGQKIDVLVLADIDDRAIREGRQDPRLPEEYRGGIGAEGVLSIKEFVINGGTLLAMNASANFALSAFDLPIAMIPVRRRTLMDATASSELVEGASTSETKEANPGTEKTPEAPQKEPAERLDAPGAILLARSSPADSATFGLPEHLPVFFDQDRAFERKADAPPEFEVQFPLTFAEKGTLLCGFAEGLGAIAGKGALARTKVGKGRIIMTSFSPQFRCQSWGTFLVILNALLPLPSSG